MEVHSSQLLIIMIHYLELDNLIPNRKPYIKIDILNGILFIMDILNNKQDHTLLLNSMIMMRSLNGRLNNTMSTNSIYISVMTYTTLDGVDTLILLISIWVKEYSDLEKTLLIQKTSSIGKQDLICTLRTLMNGL